MQTLNHTFGNEGIFWMTYRDFLLRYSQIWQTRLFGPDWTVSQYWTTVNVPWFGDYNDCSFEFSIPMATHAVVVLSQLDERYWRGLKGQYTYQLAFRLHKSGETVHIVRGFASTERSATAEADLEEGTYQVFLQISGTRRPWIPKVEDVVKENWLHRREKLLRIGLSHDLAHAKGRIPEPAKATAKSDTKQESTQTKESSPGEKKVSGEEGKKDESKVEDLNPNPNYQDELMEDIKNDDDITAEKKAASEARTPGAEPGPADTKIEVTVESAKEEETEKSEDAWDATCVVGLRVFCHDTSATIKVVRPEPMDAVSAENKLDVDDPEKDAVSKNSGSNIDKVTVTITKKDKGTETEDTNTEEAKKDPTTEEAKPEETKTNASAVKVDRETKGPATKSETQPKEEQAPVATGKSTDGATAKVTAGPQDEDKITSHEELKADDTRTEKKEATIEESKTEEMGTEDGAKANDEATPSIDSSGTEGAKFTPESSGSENTDSPTRTK